MVNNRKNLLLVMVLVISVITGLAAPAYAKGGPASFYGVVSDVEYHPLASGNITITVTDVLGNTAYSASGAILSNGWYVLTIPDYVSCCGMVYFTVSYDGNTYRKSFERDCYDGGQTYEINLQYKDIDTTAPTPAPTPEPSAAPPSGCPAANCTPAPGDVQPTACPTSLPTQGSSCENLTVCPTNNSSTCEPGNQTIPAATPITGNSSSNGTSRNGTQNVSTSPADVRGTPFPGALVALLAVIGGCALLYRLKK